MELPAAHLVDTQASPLGAIGHRQLFQPNDAVSEAVQAEIVDHLRQVVQEQDGAAALREEMLERQHLSAEAERALGEKPDFRQAVEHDPGRSDALDLVLDQLHGLSELQVRGVDD